MKKFVYIVFCLFFGLSSRGQQFDIAQKRAGHQIFSKVIENRDSTITLVQTSFFFNAGISMFHYSYSNQLLGTSIIEYPGTYVVVNDARNINDSILILVGFVLQNDTALAQGIILLHNIKCNSTFSYIIEKPGETIDIQRVLKANTPNHFVVLVTGLEKGTTSSVDYHNGSWQIISSLNRWLEGFDKIEFKSDLLFYGGGYLFIDTIADKAFQKSMFIQMDSAGRIKSVRVPERNNPECFSIGKKVEIVNGKAYLFQTNRSYIYNPISTCISYIKLNDIDANVGVETILSDTNSSEYMFRVVKSNEGQFYIGSGHDVSHDGQNIWAKLRLIDTNGKTKNLVFLNKGNIVKLGSNYCFIEDMMVSKFNYLLCAGRINNSNSIGEDGFFNSYSKSLGADIDSLINPKNVFDWHKQNQTTKIENINLINLEGQARNFYTLPFKNIKISNTEYLLNLKSQSFPEIKVWPNPIENKLFFEVPNSIKKHNLRFEIYELTTNRKVFSKLINQSDSFLGTEILSPGVYLVKIADTSTIFLQKKFIKL